MNDFGEADRAERIRRSIEQAQKDMIEDARQAKERRAFFQLQLFGLAAGALLSVLARLIWW